MTTRKSITPRGKTFNHTSMPLRTLRQFQHERDSWRRTLAFMEEENVFLKNRLAEVLNDSVDTFFLQRAESFQSNFLRADDLFSLLRVNVAEFDKLLAPELFRRGAILPVVERSYRNICKLMDNVQNKFESWKLEFSNYLIENFSARES